MSIGVESTVGSTYWIGKTFSTILTYKETIRTFRTNIIVLAELNAVQRLYSSYFTLQSIQVEIASTFLTRERRVSNSGSDIVLDTIWSFKEF